MKKCFFCFLVICFVFPLSAEPLKEKYSQFWKILFTHYHFGYTLFGNKPISFDRYYVNNFLVPAHARVPYDFILLWEEWEKENIKSKHFVLKRLRFFKDNIELEEFYLINKKTCLKCIEDHLEDFQKVFYQHSASEILELICEKGPNIIKNHRLLGILLGYGKHNATLFQKMENFSKCLDSPQILKMTFSSDELEKRIQRLNTKLVMFDVPYSSILANPLPVFKTDEKHPITKKLLQEYLTTQSQLNKLLYHPDFLQYVLNRFIKNE